MRTSARVGALTAGAALALAAALPAQAATTGNTSKAAARLSQAKRVTTARIDGRLETLRALDVALGSARDLTTSTKSALKSLLANDASGLTSLRNSVSSATSTEAVAADAKTMVEGYRIYLLVAPKTHLSIAMDIETSAASRLQKVHDALTAALAKQPGGGSSQAKTELAAMQTEIQQADSAVSGQVTAVLAITPGPDAPSIVDQLKKVRSAASSARQDPREAVSNAKDVRASLK